MNWNEMKNIISRFNVVEQQKLNKTEIKLKAELLKVTKTQKNKLIQNINNSVISKVSQ